MSLVGLLERLEAVSGEGIHFAHDRCLNNFNNSACQRCAEICPEQAIRIDELPEIDGEKCKNCLACMQVCPVDAVRGEDAVSSLLSSLNRNESHRVEVLCELHPQPELGLEDSDGIRVKGCLAGLGSGTCLALFALGMKEIVFHTEYCQDCPWSTLKQDIAEQRRIANLQLSAWGEEEVIREISDADDLQERRYWDADNPPLSRRDLFRMAAQQGQISMAKAMSPHEEVGGKRPGRNYLRTAAAMKHLFQWEIEKDVDLEGIGFALMEITDSCSACGSCAKICPTEALRFVTDEQEIGFELSYNARNCVGCELCVRVCLEEAILINHAPQIKELFGVDDPRVVQQGSLKTCRDCRSQFARTQEGDLCPICEFRAHNPLGSKLPPRVEKLVNRNRKNS